MFYILLIDVLNLWWVKISLFCKTGLNVTFFEKALVNELTLLLFVGTNCCCCFRCWLTIESFVFTGAVAALGTYGAPLFAVAQHLTVSALHNSVLWLFMKRLFNDSTKETTMISLQTIKVYRTIFERNDVYGVSVTIKHFYNNFNIFTF